MEEMMMNDSTTTTSTYDLMAMILSNLFLFVLIFGLSAMVDTNELKKQYLYPQGRRALVTGIGVQFIVMPLLGFLTIVALRDDDENTSFTKAMGMTLLVVTSSPGGSYSNLWCSLFNADLALSVTMTAFSSLFSIGFLPWNLYWYSRFAYNNNNDNNDDENNNTHDHDETTDDDDDVLHSIHFGGIAISLGIVMSAILMGTLTSWAFSSSKATRKMLFQRWANRGATLSGMALILVSAILTASSSSSEEEVFVWNQLHWKFYVGVGLPCIVGLIVSNLLSRFCCRLSKPECVSIAIECGYQNTGIASSVAVTMFASSNERAQALAVPLFYAFVQAIVIGSYCIGAWKWGWTKAPPDESFCTMLSNTYNNNQNDDNDSLEDDDENSCSTKYEDALEDVQHETNNNDDPDQDLESQSLPFSNDDDDDDDDDDFESVDNDFESVDITMDQEENCRGRTRWI